MKNFMDENFMLTNNTAISLYHDYAEKMPIIDYHCHISPKEIYDNKKFKNITEIWLYGDHYKWRAIRANGIDEKYVTGDGSDYEKFLAFAKTMPMCIGNPLYHWTHLELKKYFGINEVLNEKTAPEIYKKANEMLQGDGLRVRDIIKKSNVKVICTTDDPSDTLEYHKKLRECKDFDVKVYPAFRPDKCLQIESRKNFAPWVKKLSKVYGKDIKDLNELLKALESRIKFFDEAGCRASDHALEHVPYIEASEDEVSSIFKKALNEQDINAEEVDKYKTYMMKFFAKNYKKLGWAMELHINTIRNNNTRQFEKLGPDTGYDSIHDNRSANNLSKFLNSLEIENSLPKTILFSGNPNDLYVFATMLANFHETGVPGKMQLGAAWWFNDTRDGMIAQMKALANEGLLGRFIGMLTDSRSFLSYTRHDYFRRILCSLIGEWVENGEFPNDKELLKTIVEGICYNNAKNYFNFK